MTMRCSIGVGLLLVALSGPATAVQPLDEFLRDGRLQDGLAAYANPPDNAGRFSLAILQSLDGLQKFVAGAGKLGLNPEMAQSGIPFFRTTAPGLNQATRDAATPEKVAALFKDLKASMQKANATLATVDDGQFGVEVNVSRARMDLNGDGTVASNEMALASLGRPMGLPAQDRQGQDLVIRFDSADAAWLKGYTHFLSGILIVLTSYDWTPVWNQCAHVIFSNPDPMPAIARLSGPRGRGSMDTAQLADMIAALHEMRLELLQKDALGRARDEFRAMIGCSRLCWQRVLAETDNDHEWLPSPTQTGPGGAKITTEQITAWQSVLDELDAILKGEKLLAHWRIKPGTGINIDKLVTSPPQLDMVMLIQGSALIPYLEEGPVSNQDSWRTLTAPFGPGFVRFAIWSN